MPRWGFLESAGARLASLVDCVVASTLLAVDLVLLALTYVPAVAPTSVVFPAIFAATFPLFGWAVIVSYRLRKGTDRPWFRRGGIDLRALFARMPRVGTGIVLAAMAAAIVVLATTGRPPGNPRYDATAHTYWLDTHMVARADYLTAIDKLNRFFLSGSAVFLSFTVLVTLNHCAQRRELRESSRLVGLR